MKKSRLLSIGLAIVLCMGAAPSQEKQSGVRPIKGNARYTVYGNYSRFSLLFKGPVKHTESLENGKLTVDLTGITTSVSQSGSMLQFKDGLVRSATVGRIVNGSTRVTLLLRNGCERYEIKREVAQGPLKIDIFPNPFSVKPRTLAFSSIPMKKVAKEAEQEAVQKDQIVDLRALVRSQIEEAGATKPPSATEKSKSQPLVDFRSEAAKSALPWLLLMCASLIVTICSLIIMVVRALRRIKQARSADALRASLQHLRTSASGLGSQGRIAGVDRGNTFELSERSEDRDHFSMPAVALAEQYHRSQGDIELAMKLREQGVQKVPTRKVKVIKASKGRTKGKVTLARKLGMGKGELDLASKLHKLQEEFVEKETAA